MSSTYFLKIAKADTEELTALAYGNLAEVAFLAKRHIGELAGSTAEYHLRFTEVEFVGQPDNGSEKRTITSIAADGDTVSAVLKRKLAAEKKQAGEAPATEVSQDEDDLPQ